jgi:hypothetical protein
MQSIPGSLSPKRTRLHPLFFVSESARSPQEIFTLLAPDAASTRRNAVMRRVADAHRAGSRYRFVESRKSRTVVKRGPVLACTRSAARTCATRVHMACRWKRRCGNGNRLSRWLPIRLFVVERSMWTSRSAERGQRRHAVNSRARYQHARALAR